MTGRLLTLAEAAGLLGCSEKTLRRRIDAGTLPAFKDGGLMRVSERALAAYIFARMSKAATASPSPSRPAVSSFRARRTQKPGATLFDEPDPL